MEVVLAPFPHAGLSSKYILLRVTQAAWADLEISAPHRLDRANPLLARQEILQKFWERYSSPANIDRGTPISQLRHPKIFRLKAGQARAATWYDGDSGVVWLLRVLSLSKFHNENALYDHFGELENRSQLMPSMPELQLARGQQYFVNMRAILAATMESAIEHPKSWQQASIERPSGEVNDIGRAYVELNDELTTRYLIVPRYGEHPRDIRLPRAWLEAVAAKCFPDDERIDERYHDLPPGANVHQEHEHSLVQVRLEDG